MKTKKEIKTVLKSIRMPESLYNDINQEVSETGSNFNACALKRLTHHNKSLTPQMMIKIQNLINNAYETVKETSIEKADKLQKEADKLWTFLK